MLLDLGLDPNDANAEGRTPLMGAAAKGRSEVVQMLVDAGAELDRRDRGSRDTHIPGAVIAGITWQALDYADGLVRVGVQSAVARPETAALIRKRASPCRRRTGRFSPSASHRSARASRNRAATRKETKRHRVLFRSATVPK
jgi:hypothetical protein